MERLLENIFGATIRLRLRNRATLFSQGEAADTIYFIQTGKLQLTVVSSQGREAVLATRGPRDFLGEECLVRDSRRSSTATSLGPATLFRIEKHAMLQALHGQPRLSEQFTASLLARNVHLEEDLCDQIFDHSERRLARLLLNLSRSGPHNKRPDTTVSNFTHAMLADIVGTTRPTISFFMKGFRRFGLIDYQKDGGDIIVMAEALTDSILRDEFKTRTRLAVPGEPRKNENMNDILEEIKSARLTQDKEWGGAENDDVHEPEKWCAFIRHQLRLADRGACSLATDAITGAEEQTLIDGYRERLIKIAAVAIAATESLDRIMKKRAASPDKEAESVQRSVGRTTRRGKK
jgi:CRP/FNR family cyclic AMP-dependent transcriptional regulator